MKYGYIDETNREYVITSPNTPKPWVNYLGSPEYGAIISNNAGGYSFAKTGANGRILRYQFNSEDKPGRYLYLHDHADHDYWSASWQPVGKPLDQYKSECRHGMGYTIMDAEYKQIHSKTTYYVPLDKQYEVWSCVIENKSEEVRTLSLFGYAEFTNEPRYENDLVNLQYSQFITKTVYENNKLMQSVLNNIGETVDGNSPCRRILAMAGAKVNSYNGEREEFLGAYHSYHNPVAVEEGVCNNHLNYNGNSCGALETKIVLQPGETKQITFLLGEKTAEEMDQLVQLYVNADDRQVEKEIVALKEFFGAKMDQFKVVTPDENFNAMVNTWNAYQCFITFIWSRAASFYYCGMRNGYGYRDTVQDIQGIIHLDPEAAKEKITFMLSAQVDNGGGLPLVKFTHDAGHEDTPDDASYVKETGHPSYRADDALWLFPTIFKYVCETGDMDYLKEVIVYANQGEDSVYNHLKHAIRFSMERQGIHHMPAGLHADWNDCLRLGETGESVFVAMQLYYAFVIMEEFAKMEQDTEYLAYLAKVKEELYQVLNVECFDEDRYIRGFRETGEKIGDKASEEANLWLNPQSWAVISNVASPERAEVISDLVHQELNTQYGLVLMNPPYRKAAFDGALMQIYNASTKENGGIFSQSQGWIILAEALLGHGNRAYEYFKEVCPLTMNDEAEVRGIEPYVYGQFTESKLSPNEGKSHVHWLTGTASTMMVSMVEGILGMRMQLDGLELSPAIPSDWDVITIDKKVRGKTLHITIQNPSNKESGYTSCVLNGTKLESNFIPYELLTEENTIELVM